MTAQGIIASCSTGPLMVAPPSLTGVGAPPSTFKGILGQSYFDTSTSPRTAYVFTGVEWILDAQSSGDVNSVTGTANQITATPTTGDVVLSIPSSFVAPGTITATTGLTVTAGGITVTAGNVAINGNGTFLSLQGGAATDFIGTATLTAGQATVANTNIAAGDRIMITRSALNASPALGHLIYTINAGVNFVVDSYTDAGAAANTDVSSFTYVIVRQT